MAARIVAPATAEEAIALLAGSPAGTAVVLAGGTDLLPDLDAGIATPIQLVSLRRLPWKELRWNDHDLEIGSTLPLVELERDPVLRQRIPGLAQAIGAVGSLALRRQATVGGNIVRASPSSDLIPILLALETMVKLVGPLGARTVPLAQVLVEPRRTTLLPGELVRSIVVPSLPSAYLWQRVRPANDISQIGVAVALDTGSPGAAWRIAAAGVRPLPHRVPSAEAQLPSPKPTSSEIERAAQVASEEVEVRTDRRATDAYRRHLLRVLITRAIAMVAEGLPP